MIRIALPCGIVGGIWGLAPISVLIPITVRVEVSSATGEKGQKEMVSMVEAGVAGDALPILSFIALMALMGLLGLLAIVLARRKRQLGRIFIWVSASAMLVVALLSIFSIGLFFLPASLLLIVAAIGLKGSEKIPDEGVKR